MSVNRIRHSRILDILKKSANHGPMLIELFSILFVGLLSAGIKKKKKSFKKMRVVLGSEPLINNVYWRDSIRKIAMAETYTSAVYPSHDREDWDMVYTEKYKFFPSPFQPVMAFCELMWKYDVLITSFNGFGLNKKCYWKIQAYLLHLAKIRIVVIPFGSDAYDYRFITSPMLQNALMTQYHPYSKKSVEIRKRIDYWSKHADFLLPGIMGFDGLSRWDLLTCSPLIVDTQFWSNKEISSEIKGRKDNTEIVVGHFPNHKFVKGSEFLEAAVQILKNEGINIRILELRGKKRSEIRDTMIEEIDILFDQINFVGYALTAIEGMSCGLPVLANLSKSKHIDVLWFNSFLSECPIISINHRTLVNELRDISLNKEKRNLLGNLGKEYVEKYHSINAGANLFQDIFNHVMGNKKINPNKFAPNLQKIMLEMSRNHK